jgi:hypothetical protein
MRVLLIAAALLFLQGCASIDFDAKNKDKSDKHGLVYYVAEPGVLVKDAENCTQDVSLFMIPGEERELKFRSGWGSSNFSVELTNGMIGKASQATDPKIESLIASVFKPSAMNDNPLEKKKQCKVRTNLYRLRDIKYESNGKVEYAIPPAQEL